MRWRLRSNRGGWCIVIVYRWCASWRILAGALMLMSLTACATPLPRVLVVDSRLTAPCERPVLGGATNRDVWVLAIEQAEALDDCSERMDVLRRLTR